MLRHYGTLQALFNTGIVDLSEVINSSGKKFGTKRAEKIRKEWDEQWTTM